MEIKLEIPEFKDKLLQCIGCNTEFTWTAPEQRFYWSKNLCVPRRCARCRAFRKLTIDPRPQRTCTLCFHSLPDGYCACRELADIISTPDKCPDWASKGVANAR